MFLYLNNPFFLQLLYLFLNFYSQWKATRTGRDRAMPNIKSYTRISPDSKEIPWFLLTSANLSKAAWGSSKQYGYSIGNYEAGVVFIPKFIVSTILLFNNFWHIKLKNVYYGNMFKICVLVLLILITTSNFLDWNNNISYWGRRRYRHSNISNPIRSSIKPIWIGRWSFCRRICQLSKI